ncbi:MAG: hypothetical protein QF805_23360, partial [Pirellulaceae bacterium]|nr:hypothetical protein [Pirellulaceae bacterium]
GFTGKTYRVGFSWAVCIHFMTAIVVFYLLFAPKLYKLSRSRSFLTPADFLIDRFQSKTLGAFASLLMMFGLANYLLAQLMALGNALRGFAPESPYQAYVVGVVALAFIIVIYESLGGFRAVAW